MPTSYSVYGLGIETNVTLAELVDLPPAERVDLRFRLGAPPGSDELAVHAQREWVVSNEVDECGVPWFRSYRLEPSGGVRIDYADTTSVVIDAEGKRVWATWEPPLSHEDVATYLLGPVMGLVLRLRGIRCLHASAVAIDGGAVVFVGPSGAGKSSTAAAFARHGHAVFADDVVALDEGPTGLLVRPGFPRIRLWPDSARSLFGAENTLPRIVPTWEKLFLDLRPANSALYQRQPLPLRGVYLLRERSTFAAPIIASTNLRDALMELVHESYASRFQDGPSRARELDFLARLVKRVSVKCLTPCADFTKIDELCELVIADVRRQLHGKRA